MPTKRRRITRRLTGYLELNPAVWAAINDESGGFVFDLAAIPLAWQEHRDQVLGRWIPERPGTRPSCWWEFDAPERERVRLGGRGTPCHAALAHAVELAYGLPCTWVEDYWLGRKLDVERFDAADPPRFESQAAYLKRHGLLMPDELRKLKASAFEPEVLPREFWPAE